MRSAMLEHSCCIVPGFSSPGQMYYPKPHKSVRSAKRAFPPAWHPVTPAEVRGLLRAQGSPMPPRRRRGRSSLSPWPQTIRRRQRPSRERSAFTPGAMAGAMEPAMATSGAGVYAGAIAAHSIAGEHRHRLYPEFGRHRVVHSRVEEGVVCRAVAPVDPADRIHVKSAVLGAGVRRYRHRTHR